MHRSLERDELTNCQAYNAIQASQLVPLQTSAIGVSLPCALWVSHCLFDGQNQGGV